MKKSGIISLIILVVTMYLSQIFFDIALILVRSNNFTDEVVMTLIVVGFIVGGVAALVGVIGCLLAIFNIFQKAKNPLTTTMVCKLALIPWYAMNFLLWLIVFAGFCNPWLILATPVVLGIGVAMTYMYVVFTGVHNLSYVIGLVKGGKMQFSAFTIVALVFHFVFVLDVVGAIMLRHALRNTIE